MDDEFSNLVESMGANESIENAARHPANRYILDEDEDNAAIFNSGSPM